MLPHKNSAQRPMHSEMSFKCRSSASLSSNTLVASQSTSSTMLPTNKPEMVVGLGTCISASRSTATFLTPRPSLSSIRAHTTLAAVPRRSPIPPLPTYFLKTYRRGKTARGCRIPPRRPPRPEYAPEGENVRLITPHSHPALRDLEARKSTESLSSIYSRSISGEIRSSRVVQRTTPVSSVRSETCNDSVNHSRLQATETAGPGNTQHSAQISNEGSDSDIDDAATLQARLPCVRGVSGFGDVQEWTVRHSTAGNNDANERKRPRNQRRRLQKSRGRISQPAHVKNNGAVERTYRLIEPWKAA